jgi:nicotinate-nucleotide adenylyltransferase
MKNVKHSAFTGILGGSFDPPHLGHLAMAFLARETFGLTEVWIVPTLRHPHNKNLTDFSVRIKMLKLLFQSANPKVYKIQRDEEVLSKKNQPNYTIDTVTHFKKKYPQRKFVLLMGSDLLADLRRWKNVDRLQDLISFCVVQRPGKPVITSKKNMIVKLETPHISSTEVRLLASKNKPIFHLTGKHVAQFIDSHKIYRMPQE